MNQKEARLVREEALKKALSWQKWSDFSARTLTELDDGSEEVEQITFKMRSGRNIFLYDQEIDRSLVRNLLVQSINICEENFAQDMLKAAELAEDICT